MHLSNLGYGGIASNYQDEISALLFLTIHKNPDGLHEEEVHRKIREIYFKNFEIFGGMPDFGDIIDGVNAYNDEIIDRVSEILYINEGYWNKAISKEDALDEIRTGVVQENDWEWFDNLDYYVYDYLNANQLFFVIPESYYTYESIACEDTIILANDCQNILFDDFLKEFQEKIAVHYSKTESKLIILGG